MSLQANPTPFTNRAIKSIKTELEFLEECSLLSAEKLEQILSLLPEPAGNQIQKSIPPVTVTSSSPYSSKPALPTRKTANIPIIKETPIPAPVQHPTSEHAHSTPPPPPSYDTSEVRLVALHTYEGKHPGDLRFKTSDSIILTQKLNNDWWIGRHAITKQEGMFPANHVEIDKGGNEKKSIYGDNMMTSVAHEGQFNSGPSHHGDSSHDAQSGEKSKIEEQGKKFGSKLGNAAIFGAGATIGSKIVNGIF